MGLVTPELFTGPESLRVPRERTALWACTLMAPLTLAIVGAIFSTVSLSGFILLFVAGMLFVTVGRGRLLGSSVRIDGRQMPEIDRLVTDLALRLDMPKPLIFVRDDPFVPIAAIGIGEPYALVLSSHYIDHLRPGELAFLIARELAHIAAGHARLTSLLSASGRENPVVALAFGPWLRRTEYTADRVGLLCSNGLDDALGGISISTFHAIGRRVDMNVLAEQRRDIEAEPALRMGEWTSGMPYATRRLEALRAFALTPLATQWRDRLHATLAKREIVRDASDAPLGVTRAETAPFVRRASALAIDLVTLEAILKTPLVVDVATKANVRQIHDVPAFFVPFVQHMPALFAGAAVASIVLAYFVYSTILVSVVGQTLGMMIFELRVVTTHYARPSLLQIAWRYTLAFFTTISAIALVGVFVRVHPHDRLSRTRLVRGRRA